MIYIPDYVELVIEKLEEKGFEAYIVGGCVRDSLLGKIPSDFDITTNATPDEIELIFKEFKTVNIGKEFGTIIVVQEKGNIEITTFRIESEYKDGRRPDRVSFSNQISDDLSRRDFTINSMAYNKRKGIIDPFNGIEDLNKKIIKAVGNPYERFREDHLRIMRGIRFATELDFHIEKETYTALGAESYNLKNISAERIYVEFAKILLSPVPSIGMKLLLELHVLRILFPELCSLVGFDQKNPNHDKDIFSHSLCVLDNVYPILSLRLAALFHDIGKPDCFSLDDQGVGHFYGHDKVSLEITQNILNRLKAPTDLINKVSLLINDHMSVHNEMGLKGLKRQIARLGEDNIFYLIELQKADRLCSSDENNNIDFLIEREKEIKEIIEYKEPYEKSQLAINGKQIIDLGYKQGPLIGEILEYLLELVLENPDLNHIERLKNIIMKKYHI